jgi:hypothetical protein
VLKRKKKENCVKEELGLRRRSGQGMDKAGLIVREEFKGLQRFQKRQLRERDNNKEVGGDRRVLKMAGRTSV